MCVCGHSVGGVIKWEGGVNCRLCDYLSVRLIWDVVLGEGGVGAGWGGGHRRGNRRSDGGDSHL